MKSKTYLEENDQQEFSPVISVLTPIFNGKKYVEQCIKSVLKQERNDVEHIFIDGGSTDGTVEILAAYHEAYPTRLRYISEPDNGVGSALKKGYKLSKGKIIGWIDADDIYEPDSLQTAIDFFQKHQNAFFMYGGCNLINAESSVVGSFVIKEFDKDEWLNIWHYIVFCATFFRREVIEKVGFVNDLGNDLCFYLRVAKQFKMHRISKTLTNWRLHSDSISLKRADREHNIRKNRAKEDFFLVLKHRGSLFSPRALTYYAVLEPSIARVLRPCLGFAYPILRKLAHQIKYSIAVVQRRKRSFAYPLFRNLCVELKRSLFG